MRSIEAFVAELDRRPLSGTQHQSQLTLPLSPTTYHELPERFPPWLRHAAQTQDITQLTLGQRQALDGSNQGDHVHFMSPSSGEDKSLPMLTVFQTLGIDRTGHGLFIFPLKQREHAQWQTFLAWNDRLALEYQLSATIYDGDTPTTERRAIRQHLPHVILTTPEMLHAGILAYHSGWRSLFQGLRLVVITDLQLWSGTLLSHLCQLLRRLCRLTHHYGSKPQFLLTSTPLLNASSIAQTLTGQHCHVISGAARRPHLQHRVLIQTNDDLATIGAELVSRLQAAQLRTIFLSQTPDILTQACASDNPPLRATTPDTIQEAELALLRGSATTLVLPPSTAPDAIQPNAAHGVISLNLPGSLSHLHAWADQLAAHSTPSLAILVIQHRTALERLIVRYPDLYYLSGPIGLAATVHNPFLWRHHLLCAASELALNPDETYPGIYQLDRVLRWMASNPGLIQLTPSHQWITTAPRPHRRVNLRWFERPFSLINSQDNRRLGRLDPAQAFQNCFEGSLYLHDLNQPFHVEHVDTQRHRITMRPSTDPFITRGQFKSRVTTKRIAAAVIQPTFQLHFGAVDFVQSLDTYERLDKHSHTRQSVHLLPGTQARQIRSQATWLAFPQYTPDWHQNAQPALHTLVHAVLAILPLFIMTDGKACVGGVYPDDTEGGLNVQAIFIDTPAGGNGLAATLFQEQASIFAAALALLQQCNCTSDCACCLAPSCGSCHDQVALDRDAGRSLLQRLLGLTVVSLEHIRPVVPRTLARPHSDPAYLYLCLTTQRASDEVGGWQHKHLLGLGLAMTYHTTTGCFRVYTEETVDQLIHSLYQTKGIIGFNTRDFDYPVLQTYTDQPLSSLPTCAMLDDIQRGLGHRLNLRHLVRETLGIERPDDSLQTVAWYQSGNMERLIELCRRDIELIRGLMLHGQKTGALQYRDSSNQKSDIPVNWTFTEDHGKPTN